MKFLVRVIALILTAHSVSAHEVNVDSPMTPREEVAGVDLPPYTLSSFYTGDAGRVYSRSECYVPQERLVSYSMGEWMDHSSNDEREKLVCAIMVLGQGPGQLLKTDAKPPHRDFVRNTTLKTFILSETFRAPYNLSAIEAIGNTLVVLGGIRPSERRALLRAISE